MTVKLIPHKADQIIALEIDGWIDAEDIDRVTELIEKRLNTDEKLRIYVEVNNFSGMSLGALIKDLKFSLQHLQDFEKEAIVSDRKWLEGLAALGNTLFSGIEVKHFTPAEKDRALEWVIG
ncbi:STAS/SEC14 domain-containing protein [Pleurocapsa sp. CCALA 161]|uniref:STAS/SEC14 domain-containing protein n=1 Tax=Pleurocapsa sp. CCALA 161 TaxID=2107688 RepID=UPI000D055D26|nr:STAS/SEC14 domain-containing protein [Pleurocapsa sp. CCALA 161]PSB08926.1 STAS/SEC14 domain-containing protein [Pleurocapsa sp. CCALA 161]